MMSEARPEELAAFPVVIELPVQWGDQDAFRHVNNTVYFRWFESARIAYWEQLDRARGNAPAGIDPILAAIGCNYRRQVHYPDRVLIGTRVARIGRTSMVMEHVVWSITHRVVVADGQATVVIYDYTVHKSCPVPDEMRAAIEQLQGPIT